MIVYALDVLNFIIPSAFSFGSALVFVGVGLYLGARFHLSRWWGWVGIGISVTIVAWISFALVHEWYSCTTNALRFRCDDSHPSLLLLLIPQALAGLPFAPLGLGVLVGRTHDSARKRGIRLMIYGFGLLTILILVWGFAHLLIEDTVRWPE